MYLKFPTILLEFFYPKNYSVRLTLRIKWTGYLLYYTIVPYHAYQAVLYLLTSWPLVQVSTYDPRGRLNSYLIFH